MASPVARNLEDSDAVPVSPRIGDYCLERLLGQGGMGVVWAARDVITGAPVALKVLTSESVIQGEPPHMLDHEVRLTAGLRHPAIVTVLDAGRLEAPLALGPGKSYSAGLPFWVMERVDGGCLSPWCGKLSWERQRWILLHVLGALAHAHSRGVLHGDVKPANVLVDPFILTVKLADFGLAHRFEEAGPGGTRGVHGGTPAYMAPEQIEGRKRDFGPWTDLYAVGGLAFALAAGHPPFRGDPAEVVCGHLQAVPPPLAAGAKVPAGFEDWVRTLLHKNPQDRFQLAADAAVALAQLDSPMHARRGHCALELAGGAVACGESDPTARTVSFRSGVVRRASSPGERTTLLGPPSSLAAPCSSVPTDPIIIASTWRRPHATYVQAPPFAHGLGLFGVRAIELVGRDREQDLLWRILRRVAHDRTQEIAVLQGASGFGKSRLAEWLCERAHELGAATAVRAVHGLRAGSCHGLLAAVARRLRRAEQDAPQVWQAIRDGIRTDARRAGTTPSLLAQQDQHPRKVADKHAVLAEWLGNRASERPLILWLDDVQWAGESLDFCQSVLENSVWRGKPVLVMVTLRADARTKQGEELRMLEALTALVPTTRIEVGPIPSFARPSLVDEVVRLEPEAAVWFELLTAGDPLFLIQLLEDFVQRGLLQRGPAGFRLREGASAALPEHVGQLWQKRIDAFVCNRPLRDCIALEVAAALGPAVDWDEWRAACALAGAKASAELVSDLAHVRLARIGAGGPEHGWELVHGMLRETLAHRSRVAGRAGVVHRACAQMLTRRPSCARRSERIGRHLVQAGDGVEAIGALVRGAHERMARGDLRLARSLLTEIRAELEHCAVGRHDARRAELLVAEARLEAMRGRYGAALALVEEVESGATDEAWAGPRLSAQIERGLILVRQGNAESGLGLLRGAIERAEGAFPHQLLTGLIALGNALFWVEPAQVGGARRAEVGEVDGPQPEGLQDERVACYRRAAVLALKLGNDAAYREARFRLAHCNVSEGTAEGEQPVETSPREAPGQGGAPTGLGRAEADQAGAGHHAFALLLQAKMDFDGGEPKRAEVALHAANELFQQEGRDDMRALCLCGLWTCDAALGQWDDLPFHLEAALRLLRETGIVMAVIAEAARQAGDAALQADRRYDALRMYALAKDQMCRLGDEAGVTAIRERLRALRTG